MKLSGKKVAMLVDDLYHELELWVPYYRLQEEGAEVTLVGGKAGEIYHGKHGYPAGANLGIINASADDFDGLVIPGGYAPDMMRRRPPMVDFVKKMNQADKVIGSICHAGWMLISGQAVKGRTLTGFFAIKDDLVNAGANYVDQEVVVDGNLVTSRMPDDLPHFCRALVETLATR